jgi:hypothetical protein
MEQEAQTSGWLRKRPRVTERDIQALMAVINEQNGVVKSAVLEPFPVSVGFRKFAGVLRKLSARISRQV